MHTKKVLDPQLHNLNEGQYKHIVKRDVLS